MGYSSWRGGVGRAVSAGSALVLAAVLFLSGTIHAIPMAATDGPGEIVVQAAANKTIDQVNAKFGTKTQLVIVETNQKAVQTLVLSNTVNATLAAMLADSRSTNRVVDWAEKNVRADDPSGVAPLSWLFRAFREGASAPR